MADKEIKPTEPTPEPTGPSGSAPRGEQPGGPSGSTAGASRRVVKIQFVDDGDDAELTKALAGFRSSDTEAQTGHSQKGVVIPPAEAETAKQPAKPRGLLRRVSLTERLMPAQTDPRQPVAEPMRGSVLTLDEMAAILRARLRVLGENIGIEEARIREAAEILTAVCGGVIDLDMALQWAEEGQKAGVWARDPWGYIITPTLVHEAAALIAWQDAGLTVRGGPGSGHFSHKGRPGQVGGSEDTPGKGDDAPQTGGVGGSPSESQSFAAGMKDKDYDAWVTKLSVMPMRKLRAWQDVVMAQLEELDKQPQGEANKTAGIEQQLWQEALANAVARKNWPKDYTDPFSLPGWFAEYQAGQGAAIGEPQPSKAQEGLSTGEPVSGDTTRVGLTSARPGRTNEEVFAAMREFDDQLGGIETVTSHRVQPGVGGYMGDHEATWIIEYTGNGEAKKLVAATAKKWNQDSALLITGPDKGQATISTDFEFDDPVTPTERKAVETAMIAAAEKTGQFRGWQWYRQPHKYSVLRAVCVPQWKGVPETHKQVAGTLADFFKQMGMNHTLHEYEVGVEVLEKEGDNAYDTVLSQ